MAIKWTLEEELLIQKNLTNEEVAKIAGRTLRAVKEKRYKMTGHTEAEVQKWTDNDVRRSPASLETVETRIDRIKALARKLGVKLLGHDEWEESKA